jgi:uncharacterized hydrophobic protein (TIGR00271 family)
MTILAFVPHSDHAIAIVAWSHALREGGEDIEYVCLEKEGNEGTEKALRAALDLRQVESDNITSISSLTPVVVLLERCRRTKPSILLTARFSLDAVSGRPQTSEELIRVAPCMTISSLFGDGTLVGIERILMIVSNGPHDLAALRITELLRKRLHAKVTLATVEDESGAMAERAGEKAIRSLVHDSGLDVDQFQIKVVVDRLRHRGVRSCCKGHELIVCGRDAAKDIQPLRQSLTGTTSLVVKRAPPLRLQSLAEWLPRINASDHAELLQDLRHDSRWNSDFISMLALASGIASLGLMQNSPAVVIGSMLLAPLMTPMIGAGLALAQANVVLARQCAKSIALGLLLALAVSFVLGVITPSRETLSPEVISRGSPNVLDLLIALFAAVAATIAMARPNIVGAVAGVAIATALVPPICAVGLSLSHGSFLNAMGALVLFGTNLIAIIVASSFTFTLLGVLTVRSLPRHRRIIGSVRWGLLILLIVLAGPLSITLLSQLEEGRSQSAVFPVTRAVARALDARVGEDPGLDITFLGRSSVTDAVVIHISANHELPRSYGIELRAIVRDTMGDPELPVYVACLRGQWLNNSDDPVLSDE